MKGIDISAYQTGVDFNKLKAAGYEFVILRAGWGKVTSQKDPQFDNHYKNAKAAGLHVGAYWYSYALTDDSCKMSVEDQAKAEAETCKTILAGKQFDMPIYYDLEENKAFQKGAYSIDLLAKTFCNTMESAGYYCGIYGGQYLADNLLTEYTRNRYAFWLAQYLRNCTYRGQFGIWQFGVAGADPGNNPTGFPNVPGVPGQCDMDYCYIDYPSQIISKGLNGYPKPTTDTNTTPSKPEITKVNELKEFVPRLAIPESGNKYYNNQSAGGYAVGTILGNPLQSGLNVLSNCVGYAAARFNEIINAGEWLYLHYPPNAEDFIDKAKAEGLEISQTPSLGAIIVWAKGETHYGDDGAGHVAVVEKINADGSIVTSESGYGCSNPFWTSTRYKDNNWGAGSAYTFLGFIKNPAVKDSTLYKEPENKTNNPYKEPTTNLKEGSKGDDVKWMQYELKNKNYYIGDIDGIFGIVTLGALLAFQFKNKLTVDGICGKNTRALLKK